MNTNKLPIQQRRIQLKGHRAAVFALAQGQSERYLLSGAGEGWIVEWDLENPDPGRVIAQAEGNIFALHYFAPKQLLVAGTLTGGLHWIDLKEAERTRNIAHHKKGVFDFLVLGDTLLSVGGGGMLSRWSVAERRSTESLLLSHESLRCLEYSEKRNEIAVGASDHNIYLLDAETLVVKQTLEAAHGNSVFSLAYSPDQRYLLSGGRDAQLRVWDLEDGGKMLQNIPAHMYTINDICWHPEGDFFFTASRDKTIKVWEAGSFRLRKVLEGARDQGHFNSVNRLRWQGDALVSASDDRTLILWEGAD